MVIVIMQNRNTGEYNYTQTENAGKARAYFDKHYASNWKIAKAIEGKAIEL